MIRFAIVAALLPACTIPLDADGIPGVGVEFQADDVLLIATEAGVEQFDAVYPHSVETTVAGEGSPDKRVIRVRSVSAGFVAPGDDRPMCQYGVVGSARISGLTDENRDVWICDDMTAEHTRRVVLHEMCHVFGAPGHPHWPGEGGACSGRGDTGVISKFEKQEFKTMWKGM